MECGEVSRDLGDIVAREQGLLGRWVGGDVVLGWCIWWWWCWR